MNCLNARALPFVFTLFFAAPSLGQTVENDTPAPLIQEAGQSDLSEFVWKKRPVVVFADSTNDPAFVAQLEMLNERLGALEARDVVVLTDTNPAELSPLRKKLRPRGFMLVILSKEGRVQLRKPFPWDVREITRSIDKLPIRQREIRDAKAAE